MTDREFARRAISKRILERKFLQLRGRRFVGRMIRRARWFCRA